MEWTLQSICKLIYLVYHFPFLFSFCHLWWICRRCFHVWPVYVNGTKVVRIDSGTVGHHFWNLGWIARCQAIFHSISMKYVSIEMPSFYHSISKRTSKENWIECTYQIYIQYSEYDRFNDKWLHCMELKGKELTIKEKQSMNRNKDRNSEKETDAEAKGKKLKRTLPIRKEMDSGGERRGELELKTWEKQEEFHLDASSVNSKSDSFICKLNKF